MSHRVIHRDSEIQGGVPVFVGTRVPLKNQFDSLEAGDSLVAKLALSESPARRSLQPRATSIIRRGRLCSH